MVEVAIRKIVKRFNKTEVLHGIDLEIEDGEFVVLVGPSGCGKSTTLRMIAGLEDVTEGEIVIGGRVVNHVDPKDRNIAMVFQNYAIYPHMSVAKNIGFGLRTSTLSKAEKAERVAATATMLGLTELLERRPAQLSGGQRQRVAIGRAMVRDPSVFLFDEPLSNLDAQLRAQMRLEIKKLHRRLKRTIIFVTHDQIEAMTLADRIVIMKDGHILQIGTPTEVYHQPANMFVAQFIGSPSMNMLEGSLADGIFQVGNYRLDLPETLKGVVRGRKDVVLGIRPADLKVNHGEPKDITMSARVEIVEPLGAEALVYTDFGGTELVATADGRVPPEMGTTVTLGAEAIDLHLFDLQSGRALN